MSRSALEEETAGLLESLSKLLARFVVFPSEQDRYAVAAWALHTWALDAFDNTPRLALLSAEKGSGKTRALEILELVCRNPVQTVNMSVPVLFRLTGGETPPTILFDEAETMLGYRVAKEHEDLRGLVNGGHRRGVAVYRMVMDGKGGGEPERFETFAPVAFAGLEELPETVMARSVVVRMRRRTRGELVENLRHRQGVRLTAPLREALEAWSVRPDLSDALHELLDELTFPPGVEDRAADVWESLLVLGELAGDPWARRLQEAAASIHTRSVEEDSSLGVQLLRDVRGVFVERGNPTSLPSAEIVAGLVELEGTPWPSVKSGDPLDAQRLAQLVKRYGIRPKTLREGERTFKGYTRESFEDSWARYVPDAGTPSAPAPEEAEHTEHASHANGQPLPATLGLPL
jgi:hypothetical protein